VPRTRIAMTCIGEAGRSQASCVRSVGLARSIDAPDRTRTPAAAVPAGITASRSPPG
jgi:hypothetical protein